MSFTVAGQADIRQRLNADGLATLGLAGPLLSPVWAQTAPTADVPNFRFTVASTWNAPLAGVLVTEPNPRDLGLSRPDGTPWPLATGTAVVFRIHPQARLRLERLIVATLQLPGATVADRSLRPIPALALVTNPATTFATPEKAGAGEALMPAGDVSFYDEHGLAIDPFAFAAAIAAVLLALPDVAAPTPPGGGTGTPFAIAQLAPAGQWMHAVDLHGRPWQDPAGALRGVSIYSGAANARVLTQHVGDGSLAAWPSGNVLAAESDPGGALSALIFPALTRFGWQTVGTMGTAPLAWPAAGVQVPVRDTLRVAVCDPTFHVLGNRAGADRDSVLKADPFTIAEQLPILREGSPIALLADGRSALGWIGAVVLGLQGGDPAAAFTSGPMFAASPFFDAGDWPFPSVSGPNGAWPIQPAATPIPGSLAKILGLLSALRSGGSANWIAGTNDVVVTLPAGLPAGFAIRFYPIAIHLGGSPDEQPLLMRTDGAALITTGGATDTLVLTDPFHIKAGTPRPGAGSLLRVDAAVSWISAPGAIPLVKLIGGLAWAVGADVPASAAGPTNLLAALFWRGIASNPLIGVPPRGPFTLSAVLGDPIAFLTGLVRTLSTDANPREAPRLPTMSRNESLFAMQLLPAAGGADLYRSMLTGGWLTREIDARAHRLGNPGGAGAHEAHSPAIVAQGQLGFDLWVAAAHRARPIVPTADVAGVFASGPNAGLPTNWLLLQANATSAPPAPPVAPSTIAAALLQTVPAIVETPELAVIDDNDVAGAITWVTTKLGGFVATPNDPELHRQIAREIRTAKYGRRDAQWALRRAIAHARELVYIETPILAHTAHDLGGPQDPLAAVDLINELANRLTFEPRLRVVILIPRDPPFVAGYEPFSAYFYAERLRVAQTLALAGGTIAGPYGKRARVVIAHPVGIPGRPLVIRTTTVIVDDVWSMTGASSVSRRGLTFDGASDVALVDWQLDRGASVAIRAHRKALMATHLGVGPTPVGGGVAPDSVGAPSANWVRLHEPTSAHEVFADVVASGDRGKLLSLWAGPDPLAAGAVIPHKSDVADPDGRNQTFVTTLAAAIGGSNVV